MTKASAVIFDFDGTLVEGFTAAIATINELAKEQGYPQVTSRDIDLFRHQGAAVFLKKLKIPLWKLPKLLKRGQELNQPRLLKCPLVSEVDQVLRQLRKKIRFLAIISTNSPQSINQYLTNHHLKIFDEVAAGGVFDKHLPMKKMIQHLQLSKDEVIYVGDEPRDIKAAHRVGINSVGVSWGFSSAERLAQEKPTWLIDKPEQLLEIIN